MLNPFDTVLLARLCLQAGQPWRYAEVAGELHVSESHCHRAFNRLASAGLVRATAAGDRIVVYRPAEEFLLHGVKYSFYPELGPVARGMPTGVAGPPLAGRFVLDAEVPVWPDAHGDARGVQLKPFYPAQPKAARNHPALYEMLCLIDAVRAGRARERQAAEKEIQGRLKELEELQHERRKVSRQH